MSNPQKITVPLRIGLSELSVDPESLRHAARRGCQLQPNPTLTGEQAHLAVAIFHALRDQGVGLNAQGDVYGFLLDHLGRQLLTDETVLAARRCPGASVPCAICGGPITQQDFDRQAASVRAGRVATVAHTAHFTGPDAETNRQKLEAVHADAESRHLECPTTHRVDPSNG